MRAGRSGQSRTGPYRGTDRRAGSDVEMPHGPALVATALIAGLWLALLFATVGDILPPRLDMALLAALVDTASVTLAIVAGAACLLGWRLSGQVPSFYAGVALLLYGAVTLGAANPATQVTAAAHATANAARAGSWVVFVGLLVWAIRAPTVHSTLRPARVGLAVLAGVMVLTGVFRAAPEAGAILLGAADPQAAGAGLPGSSARLGVWLILAAAFVFSGPRRKRALFTWLGVGAAGFALIELSGVLLGSEAAAISSFLRTGVLLAVLVGASLDLQTFFTAQRGRLLDMTLTARTAEARMSADEAQSRRRTHEALNALTAIQGASSTLERFQDRLQPAQRAELLGALGAEVGRLQRLVATPPERDAIDTYSLASHLGSVIANARAEGALIDGEIDHALRASGRWADTAEALRIVLAALRARTPTARLLLTTTQADGAVVVRVEQDLGVDALPPGTPQPVEDLPGSSLDLRVAAGLVRAQGGDLLVEQQDGGLAFLFRLSVS